MKYKLIELATGKAVTYGDDNTVVFGGPWGETDENGNPKYVWVENDPPTTEELLTAIRVKRNQLLTESDWTQLPDVSLTAEQKQAWIEYRQALRDFPETCDPKNPIWPEKPL